MEPIVLAPPRPADPPAVERGWRRWEALPGGEARDAAKEAAREPPWRTVLDGLFGGSPFLSEALLAEPEVLRRLVRDGAEAAFGALLAEVEDLDVGDRARLALGLRRSRRRVALLVGLADLAGLWPLEGVTTALTRFADLAVGRVVDHLLGEAARARRAASRRPSAARGGSGVFVLGMGKHGAGELNYSSDIDLILLFDDERLPLPRQRERRWRSASRLARGLVYLLETKTKDGYVFRTDLRLRPASPGHPLAMSTDAAELYYERHGQNWERAALIKARPVAGDLRGRRGLPARPDALHLAQAPRLRGHPRHPFDQAPDQRLSRLRHGPGAAATTSRSAAAASARSSSSPRPSS